MSQDLHEAEGLEAAVAAAVAAMVGSPVEEVNVRIDAPGTDDLTGPFRVEISGGDDRSTPSDESRAREVDAGDEESSPDGPPMADRKPPASTDDSDEAVTPEQLDEEAEAAADFLEGLLDALDLPGDLRIRILEDRAEVEIAEMGTGALIGRRGQTLDAVQELVRCALQRRFERRTRVQVDAESYRSRRLEKLMEKAEEAVDEALSSGEEVRLEPMDVFERKAIHRYVASVEGVTSRSHGREPGRRVVVVPGDDE